VTAASVARQHKLKRVLSFDMGGTTAKTTLIHAGAPAITMDFEVARKYRFKKGSGLPLRVPVVDLIEIGAGGGSIVRLDALGLITVGPDSAGADPGPACYGRGGTLPTVTDADVVLGYLDPMSFLGGRMQLDAGAAHAAIDRHLAKPLGISVAAAALGVHDIVNENMANASRMQAVERGHDPGAYSLVAFGGAGPVHAWGVAKRLRLASMIVPPTAGLGSAVGLLLAPRTFRISRTHIGTLDTLDWQSIENLFGEITREAVAALRQAGVAEDRMRFLRSVDMRYSGQRKELTIDLPASRLATNGGRVLRAAFERAYARVYHRTHADHPVEALAWRLAATGPAIRRPAAPVSMNGRARVAKPSRRRPMLFPGWPGMRPCPVFARDDLTPGMTLRGPAVIEEAESTTVVGPGGVGAVDGYHNLVIELAARKPQ
jgi:N-methylhydantoinase A